MIHPLLRLAATEPHLLGDHVEAYAGLVGEEVKKTGVAYGMRFGLYAAAGVLALIGILFAGIALMVWGASSATSDYRAWWLLIVVPLVPLLGAAAAFLVAQKRPIENAFDRIKQQLRADMAVLREVSAP